RVLPTAMLCFGRAAGRRQGLDIRDQRRCHRNMARGGRDPLLGVQCRGMRATRLDANRLHEPRWCGSVVIDGKPLFHNGLCLDGSLYSRANSATSCRNSMSIEQLADIAQAMVAPGKG